MAKLMARDELTKDAKETDWERLFWVEFTYTVCHTRIYNWRTKKYSEIEYGYISYVSIEVAEHKYILHISCILH